MKKILMLSLARYDDPHTSTTFQLAHQFSRENEVLIVEHPYTWTELLKNLGTRKGRTRLKALFDSRPLLKEQGPLKILIPPAVLPVNFLPPGRLYDWLATYNHRILAKRVNKWLSGQKWETFGFVNSYNYHFPTLSKYLRGKIEKHVYHCVDPLIKPYSLRHGHRNEALAVLASDKVISTAPALNKKWEKTKPSHIITNGVNHEHFSGCTERNTTIRAYGDPVIGYFGAIERRIDFELLLSVFNRRKNWQLIMAGPADDHYVPKEIKQMSNVHFTGTYTYGEYPALLQAVDVAIVPFKADKAAQSIFPLKFYEYMSTGKPIVSTLFNTDLLKPIMDMVYIGKDSRAFEDSVALALQERGTDKIQNRKAFAASNTWKLKAESFLNYMYEKA